MRTLLWTKLPAVPKNGRLKRWTLEGTGFNFRTQRISELAVVRTRPPAGFLSKMHEQGMEFPENQRRKEPAALGWAAGTVPIPVLFLSFQPVTFRSRQLVPYKARQIGEGHERLDTGPLV